MCIYFYGNYAYKYNILTDNYNELTSIPYNFRLGSVVSDGTDIYLFGSYNSSYQQYAYKAKLTILPEIKKCAYEGIDTVDTSFYYRNGEYDNIGPFYWNQSSTAPPTTYSATIGNDIYYFGYDAANRLVISKVNILTREWTSLITTSDSIRYITKVIPVKDKIYLFGSANNASYKAYCIYNTITNSLGSIGQLPTQVSNSNCIVSVNTDIYIFLSGSTSYKYDTITNTFTQIKSWSVYSSYQGSAVAVGTDVYIFGGYDNQATAYKYDTLTGIYTQLSDVPYDFCKRSAVAIGTDVYLFGGVNNPTNTTYKYDTLTGIYSRLVDAPADISSSSISAINTKIYISSYKFTPELRLLNNYIYLFISDPSIKIKLANNLLSMLQYAAIYKDGEIAEYPCYYGDGNSWNLIEI